MKGRFSGRSRFAWAVIAGIFRALRRAEPSSECGSARSRLEVVGDEAVPLAAPHALVAAGEAAKDHAVLLRPLLQRNVHTRSRCEKHGIVVYRGKFVSKLFVPDFCDKWWRLCNDTHPSCSSMLAEVASAHGSR